MLQLPPTPDHFLLFQTPMQAWGTLFSLLDNLLNICFIFASNAHSLLPPHQGKQEASSPEVKDAFQPTRNIPGVAAQVPVRGEAWGGLLVWGESWGSDREVWRSAFGPQVSTPAYSVQEGSLSGLCIFHMVISPTMPLFKPTKSTCSGRPVSRPIIIYIMHYTSDCFFQSNTRYQLSVASGMLRYFLTFNVKNLAPYYNSYEYFPDMFYNLCFDTLWSKRQYRSIF